MLKLSTRLLNLTIFSTLTLSCSHDHQHLGMLSAASKCLATACSLNDPNQDRHRPFTRINLADLDLLTTYQYIYEDRIVNEMNKLLIRHHLQPNVKNKDRPYITPTDPAYDSKVKAFSTAFQNLTLPIDDKLLLALHPHHPIRVIGNDQSIDLKLLPDTLAVQIKEQLSEHKMRKKFESLEQRYQFFSLFSDNKDKSHALQQAFIQAFKIATLIVKYIHPKSYDHIKEYISSETYERAYKLLVLFGPNESHVAQSDLLKKVMAYIKKLKNETTQQHSKAFFDQITLPPKGNLITLSVWQVILQKHEKTAFNCFAHADIIESRLADNLELARLATQYPGLSNHVFNTCLDVFKHRKKEDHLPDITINGEEVNYPGYWLTKLPIDDPRACILGDITHCCQSIGKYGVVYVRDGIRFPNNGFYLLLKAKKRTKGNINYAYPKKADGSIDYATYDIVGQGYAWNTEQGNLTFDSWENLKVEEENERKYDRVIVPMLNLFGKEAEAYGISRITIGCTGGGRTPKIYKDQNKLGVIEIPLQGKMSKDAKGQVVVHESDLLAKERKALCESLSWNLEEFKEVIVSHKQIQWIQDASDLLKPMPQETIQALKIYGAGIPGLTLHDLSAMNPPTLAKYIRDRKQYINACMS